MGIFRDFFIKYSWIAASSYNTAYSAPRQARDEFILSDVELSSQRRPRPTVAKSVDGSRGSGFLG